MSDLNTGNVSFINYSPPLNSSNSSFAFSTSLNSNNQASNMNALVALLLLQNVMQGAQGNNMVSTAINEDGGGLHTLAYPSDDGGVINKIQADDGGWPPQTTAINDDGGYHTTALSDDGGHHKHCHHGHGRPHTTAITDDGGLHTLAYPSDDGGQPPIWGGPHTTAITDDGCWPPQNNNYQQLLLMLLMMLLMGQMNQYPPFQGCHHCCKYPQPVPLSL